MQPATGLTVFDPILHRKRVRALAGRLPALRLLAYLIGCVCDPDGWTWGLSYRRLSDELGIPHHRMGEALDALAHAGVVIDKRKDRDNSYLTNYRLDGYAYLGAEIVTSGEFPMRALRAPQGDENG